MGLTIRAVRGAECDMRQVSVAIALVFVANLLLAAYGHCIPMLSAQMEGLVSAHAHHMHHEGQPNPIEHNGHDLAVPGISTATVVVDAPAMHDLAPPLPALALLDLHDFAAKQSAVPRARARPAPFAFIHARTGRLLI